VRIRGAEAGEKEGIFGTCVGLLFVLGLFSVRRVSRAVDMRVSYFIEQVPEFQWRQHSIAVFINGCKHSFERSKIFLLKA
jgi:hypothetical protein